jgi:hypothetical protein
MERPFFRGAVANCSLRQASVGRLGGGSRRSEKEGLDGLVLV